MTIVTRSGRVCNRADEYVRKKKSDDKDKGKGKMPMRYPSKHPIFRKGYSSFTCIPGSNKWIQAEKIVNDIVEEYKHKMEKPPVGRIVLKKLDGEILNGYVLKMDFEVTDEDGTISDYFAEALIRPGTGGVVNRCLEKVIYPGSSRKKREVVTLFTTKRPRIVDESVFDGIDKDSIEALFGKNKSKLPTLGFNSFLQYTKEYFNGCQPNSIVKKEAIRKWRRMKEEEKVPYMTTAALQLKEKWLQEKKDVPQ